MTGQGEGVAQCRHSDGDVAAGEARGDGTSGLYVDPSCVHTIAEYGTYAYATSPSDGRKRDPSEEPVKQSNHALDATRYALHTELGEHAATEAYLAEMRRYAMMRTDVLVSEGDAEAVAVVAGKAVDGSGVV